MDMPKPGPQHKQLEALAGTWKGEEKMYPSEWDPKGGVANATFNTRVVCDGFYVTGDYEQKRDGAVTYQAHMVAGIDPKSSEVVMHWYDSMGMGAEIFRGKFDGQSLTLSCKNSMGQHRVSYDFREKGTLRSKMETSQDGKTWTVLFDGVYRK